VNDKGKYFAVTFRDPVEGKNFTIRARKVDDSPLGLSFIRLSDFVFDTENLVITPEEEALRKRMENTHYLHLSIYHVISIQEVGMKKAALQLKNDRSKLVVLPGPGGAKKD